MLRVTNLKSTPKQDQLWIPNLSLTKLSQSLILAKLSPKTEDIVLKAKQYDSIKSTSYRIIPNFLTLTTNQTPDCSILARFPVWHPI